MKSGESEPLALHSPLSTLHFPVTSDQGLVLGILAVSLFLFIIEKPRVDVVALLVLIACVITRLVTPSDAFISFSNPAVITVWAVFIVSGALFKTGVADRIGDLMLDQDALLVSWRGNRIDLSGTEFRMLAKLVRVPGHAVSYETLMNATMQSLVTNNTINTHMRNIRKKFEKVDPNFASIKSEYGFGYRWSAG